MAAARAELDLIGARLEKAYPKTNQGIGIVLKTFNEQFNGGPIRVVFLAMLGAVGFVAADCLRECREPAAGAIAVKDQGDLHPAWRLGPAAGGWYGSC